MTAQQLSEILQVKLSTIRKWCDYQYIPYVRLGGLVRFKKEKVEEWIRKREKREELF